MPVTVTEGEGAQAYMSAIVGDYETLHVKIDPDQLPVGAVDKNGYLKPNVPLTLDGLPITNTAGVAQVETATLVGTITGAGTVAVTVTSKALFVSPKTIQVAVANTDTAAQVATKVRAALVADAAIAAAFAISGTNADVVLTALSPAANDATLNVATANGTSTGLTAAPTSANTTAGVAPVVPCLTVEAVRIAANNLSATLIAAPPVFVACAGNGTLTRKIIVDTLGRNLTSAEVTALSSKFFVSN